MSSKFEKEVLLSIKREFSKEEKYNMLIKSYTEMQELVNKYKEQVTGLQRNNQIYKKQYAELQNKYVKICKRFSINEFANEEYL